MTSRTDLLRHLYDEIAKVLDELHATAAEPPPPPPNDPAHVPEADRY